MSHCCVTGDRCKPSLVCGDCPNNTKQNKTKLEELSPKYDYKCELCTSAAGFTVIDVYEDASFVARLELRGFIYKHLKLIQTERNMKDIDYAIKYANLYFNSIKKFI